MKILSLDIGTNAVKLVELESSFGRLDLSQYQIETIYEPIPSSAAEAATGDIETQRQILTPGQNIAIRKLLSTRLVNHDKVIVGIPRAWVTTRLMTLPSKDRKAIANSLTFELEDEIPFSINDILYDFATISSEGNSSTIFAAVALKADLIKLVSELQMIGIDPDQITIESWGLSQLLKRSLPQEYQGKPICIVNLGARTTSIHMFVGSNPAFTHTSSCSGSDITQAIASSYGIQWAEAEQAKKTGGFILTNHHLTGQSGEEVTPDQKKFAGYISESLVPMVREVKQALMSYKSQYKVAPRAVFITGGTSLLPNLAVYLEEHLRIPVFRLNYMSQVIGETLQLSEETEALIAPAAGYALCAVKPDRNSTINLRKDDVSKNGGLGAFKLENYKRPLLYLVASLGFVYMNLIVQGVILSSKMKSQDAGFEMAVKSLLGAVSPTVLNTYKNSPSTLKSAAAKEIAKYKVVTVNPPKPQVNSFEVLNKVSQTMTRDMTLDVNIFEVKDGKFKITGMIDMQSTPAKVLKNLEDSKMFTELSKVKSEDDPKSRKTKFEIVGKVAEASNATTK